MHQNSYTIDYNYTLQYTAVTHSFAMSIRVYYWYFGMATTTLAQKPTIKTAVTVLLDSVPGIGWGSQWLCRLRRG